MKHDDWKKAILIIYLLLLRVGTIDCQKRLEFCQHIGTYQCQELRFLAQSDEDHGLG